MIELQSAEGKSMLTLPLDTRVTIWLLLIDIHCKSIGYMYCQFMKVGPVGYVCRPEYEECLIGRQIFRKIFVTVHTNVV